MTELQKIDVLRHRMNLSYAEAKLALDAAGGDLVQALIEREREAQSSRDQIVQRGRQAWETLKDGALKASKAKIKLKRGQRVLFTLPAPLGALGLVGALASTQFAVAGLTGTALALAKKCTLEIEGPSQREQAAGDFSANGDI